MTLIESPSRPPQPPPPEPKRPRIGPKLKIAIDAIVFDGADLQEAALNAKITTRALRKALEKRHVVRYVRARREVLRTAASAQNIRRLVEIRDAADNMPAVQAIRELERLDTEHEAGGNAARVPGVVVIVQPGGTAVMGHDRETAAKPLIRHDVDGSDG